MEAAEWYDPTLPAGPDASQPIDGEHAPSGHWNRAAAETLLRRVMEHTATEAQVILAPLTFSELAPGAPRVPEPPKDAPRGIMLLHVEAAVVALKPKFVRRTTGVAAELDEASRQALRAVHRRVHRQHYPSSLPLTDEQCDALIDEQGPHTAEKMLRLQTRTDRIQ